MEVFDELRQAENKGTLTHKNKAAFEGWAAQTAGDVSDAALPAPPNLEDLRQLLSDPPASQGSDPAFSLQPRPGRSILTNDESPETSHSNIVANHEAATSSEATATERDNQHAAPSTSTKIINGYRYVLDQFNRVTRCSGRLKLNLDQKRNKKAQREAGGSDRLSTDEGGHIIGRRFDGPLDKINHFAQNANFNKGEHAKLEDLWAKALDAGKTVDVDIQLIYEGNSKRPHKLIVTTWVNGKISMEKFHNRRGGR